MIDHLTTFLLVFGLMLFVSGCMAIIFYLADWVMERVGYWAGAVVFIFGGSVLLTGLLLLRGAA